MFFFNSSEIFSILNFMRNSEKLKENQKNPEKRGWKILKNSEKYNEKKSTITVWRECFSINIPKPVEIPGNF